jgi:hypothetical protein
MTLRELAAGWPSGIDRTGLYRQIYLDCESVIEHTPAHLFTGRVNWKAWRRSGLYDRLRLDALVLGLVVDGQSLRDAEMCRDYALTRVGRSRRNRSAPWGELIDQWERGHAPGD